MRKSIQFAVIAKVLLAGMLITGALFPSVGGFEGKGMAVRLPLFLLPALVVPFNWLRARRAQREYSWPIGLDLALTIPFMLDTAGNAFGFYDSFDATDDVLHFVNWVVLCWGLTHYLLSKPGASNHRVLTWIAGTGLGAFLIIWWEAGEYAIMQAGTMGLNLTYGDTVGDLMLSSTGGAVGAYLAVRANRSVESQP